LLYHTQTTTTPTDLYAMQLAVSLRGPLDGDRLHKAVRTVVARHPNLAAYFTDAYGEPVQAIPADPAAPWTYVDCAASESFSQVDRDATIEQICAEERIAVCDLRRPPAFRTLLIREAVDQHRFVLTNHHIVLDGWSLPVLAGEIFASYYGQRLPAPASFRRFVTWLAERDLDSARRAWQDALSGLDAPTLVGSPGAQRPGPRATTTVDVSEDITGAVTRLARTCHTTVNTVLQAAWAQVLTWLTGHHDVVFGTAVSGRPSDLAGAESMVGLFINTVPVRATIAPTSTVADLLEQLQVAHVNTLEHQHLALSEIHRATGHDQLFDTLFVCENYPMRIGALYGNGLEITDISGRESTHYPLVMVAQPGTRLHLRVEFDTAVFTAARIDKVIARFTRLLSAMSADAGDA
ncbi:condensation domain-containing protein, partial [Mycolicibacterium obuense]